MTRIRKGQKNRMLGNIIISLLVVLTMLAIVFAIISYIRWFSQKILHDIRDQGDDDTISPRPFPKSEPAGSYNPIDFEKVYKNLETFGFRPAPRRSPILIWEGKLPPLDPPTTPDQIQNQDQDQDQDQVPTASTPGNNSNLYDKNLDLTPDAIKQWQDQIFNPDQAAAPKPKRQYKTIAQWAIEAAQKGNVTWRNSSSETPANVPTPGSGTLVDQSPASDQNQRFIPFELAKTVEAYLFDQAHCIFAPLVELNDNQDDVLIALASKPGTFLQRRRSRNLITYQYSGSDLRLTPAEMRTLIRGFYLVPSTPNNFYKWELASDLKPSFKGPVRGSIDRSLEPRLSQRGIRRRLENA